MNKYLNKSFEAIVVIYAFLFASRPLSDGDFWFHLKTGEYVIRNWAVPRTEIFSFTHFGTPWLAHGWLSGAIFYSIYSNLGANVLIFLFAVLATLAFWLALRRCHSHPFIAGFAMLLGVWTALPTVGVRPRVLTLLLSSIYLVLLERYARKDAGRAIWWLVPLMAVWVNLHGGFFIGLLLIGLTIVGIPLDSWSTGQKLSSVWPRVKVLGLVLFGCLLAGLLNPYGWRVYVSPIRVLRSPIYNRVIVDWLSPDFHSPETLPLLILILLTVGAISLSPKRIKPSELLLFIAILYSTLQTQRNMALFALVAVPLFANYLQNWLNSTSFGRSFSNSKSPASQRMTIAFSLLLVLPLFAFATKLRRDVYAPPRQEVIRVPVKAVEYLKQSQITGNTFTEPNIWGGYLIWALPSNPVYIDGRDAYPESFLEEYVAITRGRADWRGPFDRHAVRVALLQRGSLMPRELEKSTEWERVYQDEMSEVFRKREQ